MGEHKDTIIAIVFLVLGVWKIIDLILWGLGTIHVSMPIVELRDIPLIIAILLLIGCLIIIGRMQNAIKGISQKRIKVE